MLIEMWSPAFKKGDKIRKPIKFHLGLNIVLGMENAGNSIGKSSALLAIDFVFGGNSYLRSIAIKKIGDHPIYFCFKFDKNYYFSRHTEKPDIVTVYNEGYSKATSVYKLADYIQFIQEKYNLAYKDLSFRQSISGYFRIAGKSNYDPDWPLKSFNHQLAYASIINLIQFFN